jgi:hypothetical protein
MSVSFTTLPKRAGDMITAFNSKTSFRDATTQGDIDAYHIGDVIFAA